MLGVKLASLIAFIKLGTLHSGVKVSGSGVGVDWEQPVRTRNSRMNKSIKREGLSKNCIDFSPLDPGDPSQGILLMDCLAPVK
jgi:hypothetical protein